jgi:hypothetical protein
LRTLFRDQSCLWVINQVISLFIKIEKRVLCEGEIGFVLLLLYYTREILTNFCQSIAKRRSFLKTGDIQGLVPTAVFVVLVLLPWHHLS